MRPNLRNIHKLFRIAIGQRPQEQSMDRAKYGRIRPNTQRKRDDDRNRKPRSPPKRSKHLPKSHRGILPSIYTECYIAKVGQVSNLRRISNPPTQTTPASSKHSPICSKIQTNRAYRIMKPIACSLLLAACACLAQDPKDAQGCKDSPILSRFPGSVIDSCDDKADDVFSFTMGSGKPNKKIEGELHRVHYNYPKTASKAQVVRNLNTALRKAGWTFDYDSGDYGDFTVHMGKTWFMVEISGGGGIQETTVIETELKQEVVANAAELATGLNGNGHIIVNGILFDTGKADVKPESAPALEEVVKMLKQDPKVKVYVVGHTDNVGALAANLDLSRRRAASVVQMLTSKYAVAADRLAPYGDGPYAPIASNDTEDGRTLNRRVELVKQ